LTGHLRPTAPIAGDVLLPGDPGLALELGQRLLVKPLMANHSHGLWGYSGHTEAGRELTIQASGIGGPSAAVVLAELASHGARRVIRIGRAIGLEPALAAGDGVIGGASLALDGTSRALGVASPRPDPALTRALADAAAATPVTVASSDLFHDPDAADRRREWRAAGAAAADLETAALLALGARLGVAVAAGLAIGESAAGQTDEPATAKCLVELGEAAANALAAGAAAQPSASEAASLR
jgi:uridine phosphorylase